MTALLRRGEGFRVRNPSPDIHEILRPYDPVHFEADEQLIVRDGLAWSRTIARVPVTGTDASCKLAVVRMTSQRGAAKGHVLVFPGFGGLASQVAGMVPPDYPDRAVGPALAHAGYSVLVIDYGPDFIGPSRSQCLTDAADRLLSSGQSYALAIVAVGLALIDRYRSGSDAVAGVFGHSVGAFLAALVAAISDLRTPLVLASGVVSRSILHGAEAKGSVLHRLEPRADKLFSGFADLLAKLPDTPVQIQYGLHDQSFGVDALAKEACIVAARCPTNTQINACNMGHGTDVAALIRFIVDGGRAYDLAC
jgi:hypothetical protein